MNASDMRNLFRHVLFCCLVLAPVCGLRAGAVRSPYPFGFYCPEGLKECRYPVYTAVQDSSRFIWLGSESGLLKYDGYGILSYRFSPDDIHSLCNDHVNSLVYCHDYGKMVVGTDAGVSVYDFVEKMSASENMQHRLFADYIKNTGLYKYLQAHDWTAFARAYNGEGYARNGYHKKLAEAYARYSRQSSAHGR